MLLALAAGGFPLAGCSSGTAAQLLAAMLARHQLAAVKRICESETVKGRETG
jgi:hypothetical protein